MRNTLVGIVAGVAIAVLAAWITPLPGYVKSHWLSSRNKSATPSPVTVAVREDSYACDGAWMVRKPLSVLPKTPTAEDADWAPWVKAAGAADADFTHVTVTIQGRTGRVVYLTGIHFNVKRNPPIRGAMIGPGCGGPVTGRFIEVNLDQQPPRITNSSSDPKATVSASGYKPLQFPYSISDTDGLVLVIEGDARNYDDVWSADIEWSSQGVNGTTRIDDHGMPFQTSSSSYKTEMASCIGCKNPIISVVSGG